MLPIDFEALLTAITCCDAAYEPDDSIARQRFAAMGYTVLDRLSEDDAQAIAAIAPDGVTEVTIAGTRFSEGPLWARLVDLGQDADFFPHDLGNGAAVAGGAFRRVTRIWQWVRPMLAPGQKVRWRGHSLGGQSAHVVPAVVDHASIAEIIAFEPPKGGNAAYWETCQDILPLMTTVVHGPDPYFAWPPLADGLRHPPIPTLYLEAAPTQFQTLASPDLWPGADIEQPSFHDTSTVIAAIQAIVAAQKESACA